MTDFSELINDDGYRHVLGLSGGKDSAALAIYIKDHYPTFIQRLSISSLILVQS